MAVQGREYFPAANREERAFTGQKKVEEKKINGDGG